MSLTSQKVCGHSITNMMKDVCYIAVYYYGCEVTKNAGKTSRVTSSFSGKWSTPTTTGPRPPPCGHFSFTATNNHQAVFFGGYQPGCGRVSDCYLMDFESMVCPEIIVVQNAHMNALSGWDRDDQVTMIQSLQ